jgi:hypothetical protein
MANLIYKTDFSNVGVSGRQLTNFPISHAFVTETNPSATRIWMDDGTHETDSPPKPAGLWVGVEKQGSADRIEFNLNDIAATVGKNEWYIKEKICLQPDFAIRSGGWFSFLLPYQLQDSPWYPYAAIQVYNESSGISTCVKLNYSSETIYPAFIHGYPPRGVVIPVAYHVIINEGAGVCEIWFGGLDDAHKVFNLHGYRNAGAGGRELVSLIKLYTSGETRTFKAWVTDLEIWDAVPDATPTNPTLTVNSSPQGVPFTVRKVA